MFKNINNPIFKNDPKFTGYKKSAKENIKWNWEYDVKLLAAGDDLQNETQMELTQ